MSFGSAFAPLEPPKPPPGPDPVVVALVRLGEEMKANNAALTRTIDVLSRLQVPGQTAPDITELINSVIGLKGPATAEDIGLAVARHIALPDAPSTPGGLSDELASAILAALEKLDFRMKGAAFGGGGVNVGSDVMIRDASNAGQRLAVDAGGAITANVVGSITATTVPSAPYSRTKKHIEFIPSSAAPTTIYTGYAAPGTADSAPSWTIQRIVFTGVTNIDETWTTVGTATWDGRATAAYS